MSMKTPGTNRSSNYRGGTFRSGQWFCLCNKETKYVETKRGDNAGQDFRKCAQDQPCGFWLWVEHEYEARRQLANTMSPEPQTPSKSRQSDNQSRLPSTPPTGSQSAAKGSSIIAGSDRVLRSAREETPSSSQAYRGYSSPQAVDEGDELGTRVMNLLEGFNVKLNSKQARKLQVLIDDYLESMGKEPSEDEDGYLVD